VVVLAYGWMLWLTQEQCDIFAVDHRWPLLTNICIEVSQNDTVSGLWALVYLRRWFDRYGRQCLPCDGTLTTNTNIKPK
jgi:hypothetical protein